MEIGNMVYLKMVGFTEHEWNWEDGTLKEFGRVE
jgi:hypothetical protein